MTTIWDSLELWILSIVFVVWIGLKGPSIFFFGAIGAFGSTGVHSRQRVQDFVIAQVWVISLFVFLCCVQFYSLSEYSHSMLLSFLLYLCFSLEIVMYMEKRKEEVIVQANPILPVWFVFQNTLFQSRFVFFCLFLEVLRVKYERDTYAGSLRFHIMSTISFLFNLKKRFHLIYNHFIFLSFLFLTLIFLITNKKKQRDNSFWKKKKEVWESKILKNFFFLLATTMCAPE